MSMHVKIDEKEAIDLTRQLIKIPSENPPGNEREIAEYLSQKLTELGLKVLKYDFKPNRPNIIGYITGSKSEPTLMFDGHIDTVPVGDMERWTVEPFSATVKNGKIFGRGSADMKSSIAAFISALKSIIDSNLLFKGKVMLGLVSDEEISGLGTKDIISRGYIPDMAIVGEPSNLQVLTAHRGVMRWTLRTLGRAAHASSPDLGINAIYKMSKACLAIEKYYQELKKRKSHPLLGNPTICVGKIEGGVKDNVVADLCEISIDRRILPKEKPEHVEKELINILDEIKEEDKEFVYELKRYHLTDPAETDPDEKIVKVARKAVEKVIGKDLGISGLKATCEMHHLTDAGVPTIILGCGNISQAHQIDEYVEIRQLVDMARIYATIIMDLLS